MAVTIEWNEAVPAGVDDPQLGDDAIRDLKQGLRERMRQGGLAIETTASTDADAGKLCTGIQATDVLRIYGNDKTTVIAEFNDNTKVLTLGGTDDWTVDATTIMGQRFSTMSIPLSVIATGRAPGTIFENRGGGDITLHEARLVSFTAPSGGNCEIDIRVLGVSYVTPGVTAGVSVFGANPLPTITDGNNRGSIVTVFDNPALAVSKAWVFDINAINGADDVVLILKVSRTS